jgi:hypothetical protein
MNLYTNGYHILIPIFRADKTEPTPNLNYRFEIFSWQTLYTPVAVAKTKAQMQTIEGKYKYSEHHVFGGNDFVCVTIAVLLVVGTKWPNDTQRPVLVFPRIDIILQAMKVMLFLTQLQQGWGVSWNNDVSSTFHLEQWKETNGIG